MNPVSELELRLTDFANAREGFHPDQIDHIYSIYSGDHGIGKLHFVSTLVVGLLPNKAGCNEEKAMSVYPLFADVKCRKDTGAIFKATIKDDLAEGINRVEHGRMRFGKLRSLESGLAGSSILATKSLILCQMSFKMW